MGIVQEKLNNVTHHLWDLLEEEVIKKTQNTHNATPVTKMMLKTRKVFDILMR